MGPVPLSAGIPHPHWRVWTCTGTGTGQPNLTCRWPVSITSHSCRRHWNSCWGQGCSWRARIRGSLNFMAKTNHWKWGSNKQEDEIEGTSAGRFCQVWKTYRFHRSPPTCARYWTPHAEQNGQFRSGCDVSPASRGGNPNTWTVLPHCYFPRRRSGFVLVKSMA